MPTGIQKVIRVFCKCFRLGSDFIYSLPLWDLKGRMRFCSRMGTAQGRKAGWSFVVPGRLVSEGRKSLMGASVSNCIFFCDFWGLKLRGQSAHLSKYECFLSKCPSTHYNCLKERLIQGYIVSRAQEATVGQFCGSSIFVSALTTSLPHWAKGNVSLFDP